MRVRLVARRLTAELINQEPYWAVKVSAPPMVAEVGRMLLLQNDILEMVALGRPLKATLDTLGLRIEARLPGIACSVLTFDAARCLQRFSAPSLPDVYCDALEGLQGEAPEGTCASQARDRTVETAEIASDPAWAEHAYLPLAIGLKSCWTMPIIGREGASLGLLALYARQARQPHALEVDAIQAAVHLCAIAIERDQQAVAQHRLAYCDVLTDLPNRLAFTTATANLSDEQDRWSLLLVDLDNLKTVNDTFGHRAGDCLLKAAAARIRQSAAPHAAFRLGGDEFAVVVRGVGCQRASEAVVAKILSSLDEPVDCDGHLAAPRATIGWALAEPGASADEVRQGADFALYHAKETRRGRAVRYTPDLGSAIGRRLSAIRDVSAALRDNRIDAYYQPVVRLDTGEVVGLEALFRVLKEDGGVAAAGDFFDATTDIHTATRLTRRMLDIVARDVRAWLDQGIWFQHVGVNVSSADFQSGDLHEIIREAFQKEDVPLHHIILEVTETVYMGQDGHVAVEIQKMRANGLRVALDDFGTGYASLTHLLSVPVDVIKIDKSFVTRMEPESRSAAIVEGLIGMAGRLDIRVVAEGVETEAEAELLRSFGATLGQGFLYSRPADRRAITALLYERAQKRDPDINHGERSSGVEVMAHDAVASADQRLLRYAVLLCGKHWRVVSERRQFGRFATRSAAFQCALRLAREANASGAAVELLHADSAGELRAFHLAQGGAGSDREPMDVELRH